MLFNTVTALLFAVAASAIQITTPGKNNDDFKTGETVNIQWTSVATDPSEINIILRTKQADGYVDSTIAENVQTSAGSYSWTPTQTGDDLKITFINAASNSQTGLLAESEDFEVEQGTGNAAASSASGTAASSAGASAASASSPVAATPIAGSNGASAGAASGTAAPVNPNPSAPAGNAASALVPSIALVGGSLIALLM